MNTQQKEKDELQNLSIEEVNVYGSCGDPKIHCLYDCFFWNDCFITRIENIKPSSCLAY